MIQPHITIKFCGIQSCADYMMAWKLGVEYVGFVCYPPSPRYLDALTLKHLTNDIQQSITKGGIESIPPKRVGLFVDTAYDEIMEIQADIQFDVLQLYDHHIANTIPHVHWLVYSVGTRQDIIDIQNMSHSNEYLRNEHLQGIVLDTKHPTLHGGTGISFDWSWLEGFTCECPYFIAGGINKETILGLLPYQPYGIDVSSGIETARGIKDHTLMQDIVQLVRGT